MEGAGDAPVRPVARWAGRGRAVLAFARAGVDELRSAARRWPYGPWPFVLLAAIGPLWWGRPFGDLLFGQDSARLFQPFSFNDSPLIPYSYLFSSTFPVPDYTPYFYVDGALRLFDVLGAPPWLSERFLLSIFAGLAATGTIVLLRAIDAARRPAGAWTGAGTGLVALAYVYNPFTLSVSFWHFEGWTLFLAFLPWVAALAVRTTTASRPPLGLAAVVTLVGIFLAPGVVGSFSVAVGIVLLWGLLGVWVAAAGRPVRWRWALGRSGLLLGVAAGLEAWSFGALLLLPNVAYTSNNYVTRSNLFAIYSQASATWGPYPVLTLTAFSWLVRVPSAYPWIGLLPTLAVAAVVFPLSVVLGARSLRSSPGALLVFAAGLSALPLMLAPIPPIGGLDDALLRVGGPFLVVVGGYYFLGPLYLLVVVVALYEVLRRPRARAAHPASVDPAAGWRSRARSRWRRLSNAAARPSGAVTLGIAALVVVSAWPFVSANVYQTTGPNADAVSLPTSFEDLGDYFGTPSRGADYYVLVLPMSSQNALYVNISGDRFLDSSNLLASFVPYPVLETNNGPYAAAVEELFARGVPSNLTAVLDNLHVGFVVVNAFANTSATSSNQAPSGAPIDYAALLGALPGDLGAPDNVGAFEVYRVPGAIPLGWATDRLVDVRSSDLTTALGFVGALRASPPGWGAPLTSALWEPNTTLPGWTVAPTAVAGDAANVSVPAGGSAAIVTEGGSWVPPPCGAGVCTTNGTTFAWTGPELRVAGQVERTTTNPGDFQGGPNGTGVGCTPSGTTFTSTARGSLEGPARVSENVTLGRPAANNWAEVRLDSGPLEILVEGYQDGRGSPATLALSAENRGIAYVWHNTNLGGAVAAGAPWQVGVTWNATTAFATLSAGNQTVGSSLAFGDRASDQGNPGFNPAAMPTAPVSMTSANASFVLIGGGFCLLSAEAQRTPGIRYLVATDAGTPSSSAVLGTDSQVEPSGDVVVNAPATGYVVLGFPTSTLWTASGASGATVRVVAGAPFANVVAVTGPTPGPVTFHFRTAILVGLEVSFLEVAGLGFFLLVVLIGRVRKRVPPNRSTSTPDAPPPATSPALLP